jgi:FkbM family methyltransferase
VTVALETTGIALWLQRTLRTGDVVIDIGANVGIYSELAAAVVGPSGHVYAIEPGPDNLSALHQRFDTATNVTVVDAAVGNRAGTATLFMDRSDPRRHSLAAANVGKAGRMTTVRQVCLDDYRATLNRLDVIKIDAQGAELDILHGARRAIRQFKPKLVLELWPTGLRNLGASAELLHSGGCASGTDVDRR